MGATASSAQRDSGDAAAEQRTAAARDAPDDTLLHRNGQISSLNLNTKNEADEGTGHFEQRPLADVCSGFVTLKDDGTEASEDLQHVVSFQPNTKSEDRDIINADGVTVKEETSEMKEVNKINEVRFKKVFRFVGFLFTLKKDTCEKTEDEGPLADDQEEVASTSEESSVTKEKSIVAANETSLFEKTPDELLKSQVSVQPEPSEPSQKPETATELDHGTRIIEHEIIPEKGQANVGGTHPESEEPMTPIKQFFTQGIFGSLRKKKKEDEIPKETREEEIPRINQTDGVKESEGAEKVDSKCMCLDIPYIMYEEEKDSHLKVDSKLLPEGQLQNSSEKDKIQGSPLKRLFRRFSTRRQRESKAAENVIDSGKNIIEQPESSLGLTEVQKAEEPVVGEPKPALEQQVADFSSQECKKKSDSTVSWETLICGSSAKKRTRKTNEGETSDKGDEHLKEKTESPLGSLTESDYDHLTSSNEQDGEGEAGSTWKTFKKMVTPKRTGGSSSSEHIPSDSDINKDDSFSKKKLIPGLKKKKSDGRQEQTSSDEIDKDAETGDEDDETPAIIPLSDYEIIEPESIKEVNENIVKITIEHEMPELTSQGLKQDTSNDSESKPSDKVSNNAGPLIIRVQSEDYEELTDYMSKHQQLSDIPEEGIMEESIETPVPSAEWTTQDDTLAEEIVDLTADAFTAPEPASGELTGDNSTEMVSAVSQLTESPRTSGHVTPVSAEYGIQMSNMILQEAVQSICIIPRAELITTKDESQEFLAVSFLPYIIQSTRPRETKIFVAHMKTEATAICTGLVSQEMESVEELHSALLVEAIPEVSDAVLTELVSDNLTDTPEAAELGTDEVYEAKIWEVKTECQEVIMTSEEEVATETELDEEQVIQQLEVPEESHVLHMVDKNEACLTEPVSGIEIGSVEMSLTDTMETEAVLNQVISEYTHGHPEGPLYSVLVEPVYGQPVQYTEVPAEAETEMEITDATELQDKVKKVKLMHVDVSEIQVDIKDAILNTAEAALESVPEVISAAVSAVNVQEIVQQEIQDTPAEHSREVDALLISQNALETLTTVQLEEQLGIASNEVSLPEKDLVEEIENGHEVPAELHEAKEMDINVDNKKMEESAGEEADSISTAEKEKLVGKEEESFTNTESDESENQGVSALTNISMASPEIIKQDVGTANVETARAVVSESLEDVLEHKEITTALEASSNIIPTHLESVMPKNEVKRVETEEGSQDTKHSQESFKNDQPLTTNAITENQTKLSEQQKPSEVNSVVQRLEISELQKATEQEKDTSTMIDISAETIGCDQVDQARLMTATEFKKTEQKDKISVVTELEPESSTVIETATKVSESIIVAQNDDAAVQINNKNVSEQKDEEKGEARQKCEPLEHLIEEPLEIELQIEKAEIINEIPSVTHLKEEASAVSTPEVASIEQLPPLPSEMKAATPEVSVPEIQKQEAIELGVATFEMTEPKIETPVVTEVTVETAVVTDLSVETPAVTSVVTMTSSLSQNSDMDTVIEMSDLTPVLTPTVGSVVMVPAVVETTAVVLVTEATPAVTQVPEPVVSPLVETPVISIISIHKPTVDAAAQTPADETSATVLVTVTEAVAPGLTPVAQTLFVSPAVELPEMEPPAVEPPAVMLPATAVPEASPVTAVVETPALVSVMATEAASPAVTLVVSAGAETSVMSLVKTPDLTPVVQTPALVSVTAREAAHSVATPTVTAAVKKSVMETPSNSTADTPVSPVVVTLPEVSVRKTPAVTPPEETLGVDGLMDTFVGTSVPKASQVTLEVPVVTSEPQSEVEDDVWEDAVDNIIDDLMTQTDTAAKGDSDAVV